MSARYLVTGGAGFVGAGLVRRLLERGNDVVVLDSGLAAGFAYLDELQLTAIRGDVRDRDAVKRAVAGCDGVIHLAAQASVPDSIARPLDDFEVNATGSLLLLEAARAAGVERFVFASSNAVVSGHPPPAHEGLVPWPVSPYGAAKAATEAYLRAYHEAYGLVTVALRFANAYGPWSAHKSSVVAAFVKRYLAGDPVTIRGSGEQTRDYVHLDDIVDFVVACLDAPPASIAGEAFQVGTGRETSINELLELLAEAGGGEVHRSHEAPSPGDVARNVSNIDKARRQIGFEPRVALADGLAQTLAWFRSDPRAPVLSATEHAGE